MKPAQRGGLTVRSLIAGALLSVVCGATGPFLFLYVQGSNTGDAYYTSPVAHFLFFIIVGFLNVGLRAIHRPWAFGNGELVTIYIMMTLANGTHPLVHYWASELGGPAYYATAENNWMNLVQPYSGTNWQIWLKPLVGWVPMILALHVGTLCIMVLVRRQWSERERIIYPLVQVSLAMIQRDERDSLINPFFRSRVMWFGFAVPAVIGGLQGLNSYYPAVPTVEYYTYLELVPGLLTLPAVLSFATLGFFFLIKREVAFGLWVFYLVNLLQRTVYALLGIGWNEEPAITIWSYNVPSLVHQSMGR